MRQNFNLNKRRREEAKKKKRDEKMAKRLNSKTESVSESQPPAVDASPDASLTLPQ